MVDESSTIPAVVMPYATTATTTKASSTLRATSYEDTSAPRSNSVPAPTASGSAAAGAAGPDTRSHSVSAVSSSPGVVNAARPATSSSQRNKSSVTGLRNAEQSSKDKERSGLSVRNIPSIIVNDAAGFRPSSRPGSRPGSRWSERKWAAGLRTKKSAEFEGQQSSSSAQQAAPQSSQPDPETPFNGISLDIPTGGLDELGPQSMRFSKRGSLIKDVEKAKLEMNAVSEQQEQEQEQEQEQQEKENEEEKRQGVEEPQGLQDQSQQPDQSEPQGQEASPVPTTSTDQNDPQQQPPQIYGAPPRRLKPSGSLRVRQVAIPSRAISADEDMLSRRVRLMYEKGEENVSDTEVAESLAAENGVLWEESPGAADTPDTGSSSTTKRVSAIMPDQRNATPKKESNELAGGVEYWQNIRAGDVDRYGFIRPKTDHNGDGSNPIQRVSTSLLLASETPRRKHSIRPSSGVASNRSFTGRSPTRKLSESSMRPTSSQSTYSATVRRSGSRFRQATNHLPHNRNRRVTDEAADMLTLPIEAVDSANGIDSATARSMKKKEWEREDKWTKMARPTKRSKDGGGMTFEFDIQSSKLIERTWKGIPDRWRSTAWYSFLEASAKKRSDSPTEGQLIEAYHEYQYVSSPDDVQIDIDVPRTITSHIMFRRRYRGGQRLLFRVLHAMSLYFPDTGYVQGMAALAATLLAYFDEEHAFIMLVRLWQLRGLERLYECGFAGLMGALDDFEKEWLAGGEVATKLIELGIPPTAYGTRWYLTLFNYSIPFPAQLRVWDVFMLLGDTDLTPSPSILPRPSSKPPHNQQGTQDAAAGSGFGKGLDVLHATSAALIDGMRDIILESDFENAMKVLTSWVPIKDVELFMRVARAEWKVHHRKRVL